MRSSYLYICALIDICGHVMGHKVFVRYHVRALLGTPQNIFRHKITKCRVYAGDVSFFSCKRGGDTTGRAVGDPAAGFITSDNLPLEGGDVERRSTAIRSSVGEGAVEAGDDDNVAIGGKFMVATELACEA